MSMLVLSMCAQNSSEQGRMVTLTLSELAQSSGHVQCAMSMLSTLHISRTLSMDIGDWCIQMTLLLGAEPSDCAGPQCTCPEIQASLVSQEHLEPAMHA